MGRLTSDELENLYRLQMDENSVDLFNALVKSEIHEYSKVLAKNIIASIEDFMEKVKDKYKKRREVKFGHAFTRHLALFSYGSEIPHFTIKHWVADGYFNESVKINLIFEAGGTLFDKIEDLNLFDKLIRKREALGNMINTQQLDNPKLYKYLISYLRTFLYITIQNKLN